MIACRFEDGGEAFLRHVVVDTIVIRDGKVLLVKRTKSLLEGGKWGLVGGYVERDETLQEAVKREVFEEAGWRVIDISLFRIKDKPDRPNEDRQNIAFVFICTADKEEGKMDWESDEIRWFALDKIPAKDELAFDHPEDLNLYMKYLNKEISLPLT